MLPACSPTSDAWGSTASAAAPASAGSLAISVSESWGVLLGDGLTSTSGATGVCAPLALPRPLELLGLGDMLATMRDTTIRELLDVAYAAVWRYRAHTTGEHTLQVPCTDS